jgi:hypothetical protein
MADWKGDPFAAVTNLPTGTVWSDTHVKREIEERSPTKGGRQWALGIARVAQVDYNLHTVSLQILTGGLNTEIKAPIPITYPGGGPRHFLGAMPTVGATCVIGYLPTMPMRKPVILCWDIGNPWMGQDWIPTQEHLPTEFDMNPRKEAEYEGLTHRKRHKIRHMDPGNIVASSAQGADLILDESATLMDRRGDEIRLRDQDSAMVFRSLQQFHATGGTRAYIGMVQRDASFLLSNMVSDGLLWDGLNQTEDGVPRGPEEFVDSASRPAGTINPHRAFFRTDPTNPVRDSRLLIQASVDPYNFLRKGLFIGDNGVVLDPSLTIPEAEYNGKPIFRVSLDPNADSPDNLPANAAIQTGAESETLTEHRIEVNHTWDGSLPVTEQTDGFDADRLPTGNGEEGDVLGGGDKPFIEWVLGSYIGNDPYSEKGRKLYAQPIVPQILADDGTVSAALLSGVGRDMNTHAATMFRLEPPLQPNFAPTWHSFTKDGRFKANVSGPRDQNSVEVSTAGGILVKAGGAIDLRTGSPLKIQAPSGDDEENMGFCFDSPTGAICLTAGGATTRGSFTARTNPDALDELQLPGLILEAPTSSVWVTAGRTVMIAAADQIQLVNANEVKISPRNNVQILSDKISMQCTTLDRTVTGQESTFYSGPKNFLPTNLPLRRVTVGGTPLTGHIGGDTDVYKMYLGNRVETIILGGHTTRVLVGNMEYSTGVGTHTVRAGVPPALSQTIHGPGTITSTATGSITLSANIAATVRGSAAVTVSANGPAIISGKPSTVLGGSGKVGLILSSVDLDPLSGLSYFAIFGPGAGSAGHILGPAI